MTSMDPLDYLIEDCWQHLFQFLPAQDKQALSESCWSFQAMLQPEKTKWGFELILPHVLPLLESDDEDIDSMKISEELKMVLGLRSVCKSWKSAFDKYCEIGGTYCYSFQEIHRFYDFSDVSKLEKFLTTFKNHAGNPFVGRQVTIYVPPSEPEEPSTERELASSVDENEIDLSEDEEEDPARDENYDEQELPHQAGMQQRQRQEQERKERRLKTHQLLMELLTKHGDHIHSVSLLNNNNTGGMDVGSKLEACKFLQFVLCNTPNLVILGLRLLRYVGREEEDTTAFQKAVTEYFESNPLPKMPCLRKLNLYGINSSLENLVLEAYGDKLESLYTYNTKAITTSLWVNMKCLRKLNLYRSNFECTEMILRALQSPLEILYVDNNAHGRIRRIQNAGQKQVFQIDKFLLAVQHLPLKQVTIYPDSGTLKESVPFPASFPKNVTITNLSIPRANCVSLSFLKFVPRLTYLLIEGFQIPCPTIYQHKK